MPPKVKRDLTAILYDCRVSKEYEILAKKCIDDMYTLRSLGDGKCLMSLYIVNSYKTNNELTTHSNLKSGVGVFCAEKFVLPKPSRPSVYLESEEATIHEGSGSVIEALKVALHDIEECTDHINIRCAQIVLLSDFANFEEQPTINFQNMMYKMKSMNVYLYVLVPHMMPAFTLSNYSDIVEWRTFSKHNRTGLEHAKYLDTSAFKVVKELVNLYDNSIICDVRLGIHIVDFYKHWVMPQPFSLPLSVSENHILPVVSFKGLKNVGKVKLRNSQVGCNRWKYIQASNPTEEVNFDDVVRGFLTHGTLVVLTDDVAEIMFKVEGPREFELVGFISTEKVPEWLLCGDSTSLIKPKTDEAIEPVMALMQAMIQRNKYAIVRRRYIPNKLRRYFALLPNMECGMFIMTELPFVHCVVDRFIATKEVDSETLKVDDALQEPLFNFLDEIDITNGKCSLPLGFGAMHNAFHLMAARNVLNKLQKKPMTETEEWFDTGVDLPSQLKQIWPLHEEKENV